MEKECCMPRRVLMSVLVFTAVVGAALATTASAMADDDICPPTNSDVVVEIMDVPA
jgi:hypothetical protein